MCDHVTVPKGTLSTRTKLAVESAVAAVGMLALGGADATSYSRLVEFEVYA